jgi:thiol-disulfide isomerase/thioredoxin
VTDPQGPTAPRAALGFLEGRLLRRATRADVAAIVALLLLACATVVAGRCAARRLQPTSTAELASMLDNLEMPTRLPDVPLADLDGKTALLSARVVGPNAVVAFYAPWCGPCQKELPMLVSQLGSLTAILVVVGPDEDLVDTKRQIANLGVEVTLLVDTTGALTAGGKVTALPTTFLISRDRAVLVGTRGYSWLALYRMHQRLAPEGTSTPGFGDE